MTTLEMEYAVMRSMNVRQNLVVPNVSWGMGLRHECDVLVLSKSDYATEIEIKISKGDLLKDKEKRHGHSHPLISRLFFAVPENLKDVALSEIPEHAGLLVVKKKLNTYYGRTEYVVSEVRGCKRNTKALKWSDDGRLNLARLGAMRILGLKKKLIQNKEKCTII